MPLVYDDGRPVLDERFWSKVSRGDGCWLWLASCDTNGYGMFGVSRGKTRKAMRIMWEWANGRMLEAGECVMHSCDNRRCVNPSHLSVGTHAENMRDMSLRGRSARGERSSRAKLTSGDVVEIRRLKATGMSSRDIAAMFGVTYGPIDQIVRRATWRHV